MVKAAADFGYQGDHSGGILELVVCEAAQWTTLRSHCRSDDREIK